MIARALERATRAALDLWRHLSIDARIIASLGGLLPGLAA